MEDQEQERSLASRCCSYGSGAFVGSRSPTPHKFISITLYRYRQCSNLQAAPPESTREKKEKTSRAERPAVIVGKQ